MKRALFLGLSLMLLSSSAFAQVEWSPVQAAYAKLPLKVTGMVIPREGALSVESTRVSGRVITILKREGESVEAGAPLFNISSPECISIQQDRLIAQKRNLEELTIAVEHKSKLLGLVVTQDACLFLSSHHGVINKINVGSGSAFNAGDALATVLDVQQLTIELDVPEGEMNKIKKGLLARVQFSSYPDQVLTTEIENIIPIIDPTTRTIKVRLKSVPLDQKVLMDALVFGEIETSADDLLLKVPTSSLVFSENQQYVLKQSHGKPVAVAVQVLNESENSAFVRAIHAGQLREGELVARTQALFLFKKIQGDAQQ